MRRFCVLLSIFFIILPGFSGEDYQLFKKAKELWYKEDWAQAGRAYEQIVEEYPDSQFFFKSIYHLAYCKYHLNEKLGAFALLSDLTRDNRVDDENLVEDAKSFRLRIAYELARKEVGMKDVLIEGLKDPIEDIAFQAASWLAKLDDPSGLEILFRVVERENDADLRDKAVKDILKVGSEADRKRLDTILEEKKGQSDASAPKMLRLVVRDLKTDQETIKINLPISLFNIIFKSLSPEQRDLIEEGGVDLNNLAKSLKTMKPGSVLFEVRNNEEEIRLFLD